MITVILVNVTHEAITRRYDTNSFDEAVEDLVDDWVGGEIIWDWEETNERLSPEWMERNGYPFDGFEPQIDKETEVCSYTWHCCGETDGDDEIVYGYFIKSARVQDNEWPTAGVP